jgi:hypothetical protein
MSATGFVLFAAAQIRRANPSSGPSADDLRWRFLPTGLYLVVALLLAAAIIALASRWRRAPRSATVSASDQLTEFRLLYEKGQMSRDEFERVRARLGGEMRGTEPAAKPGLTQSPPQPTATTTPAPATPEPATPAAPAAAEATASNTPTTDGPSQTPPQQATTTPPVTATEPTTAAAPLPTTEQPTPSTAPTPVPPAAESTNNHEQPPETTRPN